MFTKIVSVLQLLVAVSVLHAQGWYTQTSGTNSLLMDLYFVNPDTGWVVGITNTILHTTDGGSTWNAQSPPPSVNYYSVFFTDQNTGHAVGATVGGSGRIRHTTNSGNTWDSIPISSGYSLWSVFFVDDTIGWIAGGREQGFNIDPIRTIHYSSDGGYNWSVRLYQYDSLPLHDVHFVNRFTGCAVGEHGVIMWTTDGGSSWTNLTSGTASHLWGVYLLDDNTAWAVGVQGTVIRTTNAGASWIALDIDSSYSYSKVMFVDADNGWISGGDTDEGIVMHTTDGGITWHTQHTGAAVSLASVHFTDADSGWAVGNIGTIIHTTSGGTAVVEKASVIEIPAEFMLSQNEPNPFNRTTDIRFAIPRTEHITLKVYNMIGQVVVTLVDDVLEAGEYSARLNAQYLPSGVYLYRLSAGDRAQMKRCILLK